MSGGKRRAVGLDFGTSTTLVSSATGIVAIGESLPWMPSVVGYGDDGLVVVGEEAEAAPAGQAVRSIKRLITQRSDFVRVDTPTGPREVRADDLIVELLREAARRGVAGGQDLTGPGTVRLGCPAMWDGAQRRRLVALAQRAGLPVTLASVVDEPVAAGIAWLASHPGGAASDRPLRVLVFDMGGGTLDVAVLDARGANVAVLAAVGVAEAGDTLDAGLAEDLDFALGAIGVDLDGFSDPARARHRLTYAARTAKVALTSANETDVKLSQRLFGVASIVYTRGQLNEVFAAQLDRAEQLVAVALQVARLTEATPGTAFDIARTPIDTLVGGVDVVLLSGGMSQIPYVAERLRWMFPPTTRVELAATAPEYAVALGLARAGQYGRINMYRPAFDVVVEWDRGAQSRTVYDAFTPLVEAGQIARGRELRFLRTGLDLDLPAKGKGRLKVVSHSGGRLRASLGDRALDGFPVTFSEEKFEFSIYPNGRIRLTDGTGTSDGHVEDWFTVRESAD